MSDSGNHRRSLPLSSLQDNRVKWLVTGAASFIGFDFAGELLRNGIEVVGIDSVSDYCGPNLKIACQELL